MNFGLGLPKSRNGHDSILVVMDTFSKLANFVPCDKFYYECLIANLFFKEMVRLLVFLEALYLTKTLSSLLIIGEFYGTR